MWVRVCLVRTLKAMSYSYDATSGSVAFFWGEAVCETGAVSPLVLRSSIVLKWVVRLQQERC